MPCKGGFVGWVVGEVTGWELGGGEGRFCVGNVGWVVDTVVPMRNDNGVECG